MAERQAYHVPSLHLDTRRLDQDTQRAVEDLTREVQRILRDVAEHVDTAVGLRGEATLYGTLNVNQQRLTGLAEPQNFNDAQIYGWSLSHDGASVFDTRGLSITGLPEASEQHQAVPLAQLQETISALAMVYAPRDADYVVGTAHAALTAERVATDTPSIDVDLATAGQVKWHVLPAGVDHNTLANLTTGDPHTQYQEADEKDAANGFAGLNSVSRTTKGVDTTDDVIVDLATKGLVLKDTQGTPHYWRVTVSVLGVLTTTDLGTTKP